ncbi:MAG TPA: DUF1501 domain-containing protein [Bacteroidia bacterium]|nr:DUF1501 domain-containing protein [Bacteroidia bacterium]
MNRRDFIKQSALVSGSILLPSFLKPLSALGNSTGNKKLVIIQLSGGNDGLNTIVPYRNDIYYKVRPSISIAKDTVLKLNDELGFNPALKPLKSLFDAGNMCIINGVGYPNPDKSHFRSMDIWQSASSSSEVISTGWLGRYLDSNCDGCIQPHHAIETDDSLSLALKGAARKGMAIKEPAQLSRVANEPFIKNVCSAVQTNMLTDDNLGYLYKTLIESEQSANYVYSKVKTQKNIAEFDKEKFSQSMSLISRFILSGLSTKVYYTSIGSFDTHANQNNQQDRLLGQFAQGVKSFMDDIEQSSFKDDVLIMVFSEFGRRVAQNAGQGTDHGTASNMFLIGHNLKKQGLYNNPSNLQNLIDGDLIYDVDFRDVYATVLNKWLDADAKKIIGNGCNVLDFL